jgi:chemotaxis protein CheD
VNALVPDEISEIIVHIHAGQLFVSPSPITLSTVLGSCVAVCLFDYELRYGGANHYLLPFREGAGATARFGNVAIDELVTRMLALGSRRRDLRAKIFGGACTIAGRDPEESLGAQNVEVARELLDRYEITIVAEDVGGTRGRKLLFHTDGGECWVRRL